MLRTRILCCVVVLLLAGVAKSDDAAKPAKASKPKEQSLDGMSIVGNDEAPKSLAIVPWKGSELGDTLNAIKALDADRQPVDKDVFVRELDYYEIRVGAAHLGSVARK
ncbi:MAG: hypothetical protein GY944_04905 [bacterium]|nr:hypothetical protein [bacterium]